MILNAAILPLSSQGYAICFVVGFFLALLAYEFRIDREWAVIADRSPF